MGIYRVDRVARALQTSSTMHHTSMILAAVGLSVAAAACSSSSEDTSGTDEGATVIDPHGTDAPGSLRVTVPATTPNVTVRCGDTVKAPGDVFKPMSVGPHSCNLENKGDYNISTFASASVAAGQMTTLKGARLAVDATTGPRTLGIGKDTSPWGVRLNHPAIGMLGLMKADLTGATAMGLFPGHYEVAYGIDGADGIGVDVAAGGKLKVRLSDPSTRRVARLTTSKRDMPTGSCAADDPAAADVIKVSIPPDPHQASAQPNPFVRPLTLRSEDSIDIGASKARPEVTYEIQATAWNEPVALPLGALGQGPAVTTLGRIDVDHVLVNAASPRVAGRYRIYRATASGDRGPELLRCSMSTRTGVDVPPGKYRVEVVYQTAEAGQKTDVHVLDVP